METNDKAQNTVPTPKNMRELMDFNDATLANLDAAAREGQGRASWGALDAAIDEIDYGTFRPWVESRCFADRLGFAYQLAARCWPHNLVWVGAEILLHKLPGPSLEARPGPFSPPWEVLRLSHNGLDKKRIDYGYAQLDRMMAEKRGAFGSSLEGEESRIDITAGRKVDVCVAMVNAMQKTGYLKRYLEAGESRYRYPLPEFAEGFPGKVQLRDPEALLRFFTVNPCWSVEMLRRIFDEAAQSRAWDENGSELYKAKSVRCLLKNIVEIWEERFDREYPRPRLVQAKGQDFYGKIEKKRAGSRARTRKLRRRRRRQP